MILDEFILAGEIQETSKKARAFVMHASTQRPCSLDLRCCARQVILERMEELERLELAESGTLLDRMAAGI